MSENTNKKPNNTTSNKNKALLDEQNKNKTNQAIKKSVAIGVDRGLKFTWKEYHEQNGFLKKITMGAILTNVVLVGVLAYSIETTTFFILDNQQKPVQLQQLEKLPLTESRVFSFVNEAIVQTFSFNFRYIENQLELSRKYFSDATYEKFIAELTNSNYISLVKKNKAIMTVVPTPTVFKINVIGNDTIEVIRSFAREDISKNVIETEETAYRTIIERIVPSDKNPWGFVVKELKEVNIKDYTSKKL